MRMSAKPIFLLCSVLTLASCNTRGDLVEDDAAVVSARLIDTTTVVMPPTGVTYADTAIYELYPDQNQGSDTGVSAGPDAVALFRFDRAAVASALSGRSLLTATLRISTDTCAFQTFSVHRMLEPFDEISSTWNCYEQDGAGCNQAWSGSWTGPSYPYVPEPTARWTCQDWGADTEFDVTADVYRMLADPDDSHGWAVRSGGSGYLSMYTREGLAAQSPRLVLVHEQDDFEPREPLAAPALDRGTTTHVYDSMSWLFSPTYGLQWGLNPDAISRERAALIRGRVFDRDGDPLAGVEVSILDRPELGRTRTRMNVAGTAPTGTFELVVNGGGPMVLEFRHGDYLLAQRTVDVPWNDWISAPDVVMTPRAELTCGTATSSGGFLFGANAANPDGRGARWMGVYIPPGTGVDEDRDGAAEHTSFDVCMTENTTGTLVSNVCTNDSDCAIGLCHAGSCRLEREAGMPGELPATTAYTFAGEYEVRASGTAVAHGYDFVGNGGDGLPSTADDGLVYAYVRGDGLASFAAGTAVPVGTYDATRGAWVPGNDGVVVRVDRTGGGCALTPTLPSAEASAICANTTRFQHDQRFWRAPMRHFSPCDLNFLAGLLGNLPTADSPDDGGDPDCASTATGSIIHCETQALGESVPLTGTPLNLSYVSTHQQGRRDAFRVAVKPITETTLAVEPAGVRVELLVAGRRIPAIGSPFTVAEARSTQEVVWDGLDAYGRRMLGPQLAYLRIGYEYDEGYVAPATGSTRSFGRAYGVSGTVSAGTTTVWITSRVSVGVLDDRVSGLGGWRLDAHHAYDPATGTLFYATGQTRTASSLSAVTNTVATVPSSTIQAVAAGPDGSTYFFWNGRIRRLPRNASAYEDFGPTGVISSGRGLAVSRDGLLYVADPVRDCVHRINLETGAHDSLIGVCDLSGSTNSPGPDAPVLNPTTTRLSNPQGVAVGPDGSVYVADSGNNRVVRYVPGPLDVIGAGRDRSESLVELVAGGTCADTTRAACSPAGAVASVAVGPDGSVFYHRNGGTGFNPAIMQVTPTGRIRVHVGGGASGADPADGAIAACSGISDTACAAILAYPNVYAIAVDRSGDVCYQQAATSGFDRRVRCVREDGRVQTIAGLGWSGSSSLTCPDASGLCWPRTNSGFPSTRSDISSEGAVAWSPDGRLFYGDGAFLRVVEPRLDRSLISNHVIASEDGAVLYEFSEGGRHLRTLDALTKVALIEFDYRTDGRLQGFWDVERAYTSIAYPSLVPTIRITAPGSLLTTLTLVGGGGYPAGEGYVKSIQNPAGDVWGASLDAFQYHPTLIGTLTRFTDTLGHEHNFGYELTTGRLLTDQDSADDPPPTIPTQELARSTEADHELVTRESAGGHVTNYRFGYSGNPGRRRIETPTGAYVDSTIRPDGRESTTTRWDGTTITTTTSPDPLLGSGASFPSRVVMDRPIAGQTVVTASRSYTGGGLPRIDSMTNGARTFARTISASGPGHSIVTNSESSATDRRVTTTLDSQGRITRVAVPGQHPICVSYTSSTSVRPSQILQAPLSGATCNPSASERRRTDYGYHSSQRWLTSITRETEIASLVPDGRGWMQSVTLPGRTDPLVIQRDGQGNLTWIETPGHPSSERHQFAYTGRGLPRTYTPPPVAPYAGPEITDTTYTLDGRPDVLTFRDGRVIDYAYDTNGALIGIEGTSSGVDLNYEVGLDPAGRLETGKGGGQVLERTYDGFYLLAETWSGLTSGEVEHWTSPTWTGSVLATQAARIGTVSQTVSYSFDDDLWITGAGISPSLPSVSLSHNAPIGTERTTYVDVGAAWMDVIQNGFGETRRIIAQHSGTVLDRQVCTRDLRGRITKVLETVASPSGGAATTRREEYQYDGAGRLSQWRRTGTCSSCTAICSASWSTYSYDDAGNRTDLAFNDEDQHTSGGRTYNAIGQMTARSYGVAGTGTLEHDRFGRLARFTVGSLTWDFTYDVTGRLVGFSDATGAYEHFVYRDALEPLAWKRHWWNGSAWIDDYVFFGYASRAHTPDVMWRDRGGDGIDGTYRIVPDERGSVRAVIDVGTGAIVQRIDYDPWGVPAYTGAAPDFTRFQPFGFAGGIFMPSQMWHFGARDYDPAIGRWTTKDPILFSGGTNLYEYASSDPINYIDVTGMNRGRIVFRVLEWGAKHGDRMRRSGEVLDNLDDAADALRQGENLMAEGGSAAAREAAAREAARRAGGGRPPVADGRHRRAHGHSARPHFHPHGRAGGKSFYSAQGGGGGDDGCPETGSDFYDIMRLADPFRGVGLPGIDETNPNWWDIGPRRTAI